MVHAQPPRLSHFLRADFSQIQAVLDRALSKQPRDRFDTIAAFASALASAAAPLIRAAAAPPAARIRTVRRFPGVNVVVPRDEDDPPPPIRRSAGRPFVGPDQTLVTSRRRRRAAVLGVAALGLAAVIAHETWPRLHARIHEPTQIVMGAGSLLPVQRSRELGP